MTDSDSSPRSRKGARGMIALEIIGALVVGTVLAIGVYHIIVRQPQKGKRK